jgi:hypothetical protein
MEPKQNKTRPNSALKQKNKKKKTETVIAFCFFFFSPRFGAIGFSTPIKKKEKKKKKENAMAVSLSFSSCYNKTKKRRGWQLPSPSAFQKKP